ncbi:hypothetical protein T265_07892 [Opisthorchis viverrini]|uniref:Reverse transcriptase domain-containing protein n=1 Tax=Opisthorchis viverrini TaxID=6198 RepID=A0A074ZAY5_OPIVI|nr:hypothetical protein T265_07892 [Opisthorchis viverrini]KER24466.1 hypothetical protein T265_07892 [Opisthorchis viverrini]
MISTIVRQRYTCERPTILVFLDFRGAFDSVDRSLLLDTPAHQGKFVDIIRSQTCRHVRVYGELSKSFRTQSGVHQG